MAGTYYPDNFVFKRQNLPAVSDYAVSEVNVHELKTSCSNNNAPFTKQSMTVMTLSKCYLCVQGRSKSNISNVTLELKKKHMRKKYLSAGKEAKQKERKYNCQASRLEL